MKRLVQSFILCLISLLISCSSLNRFDDAGKKNYDEEVLSRYKDLSTLETTEGIASYYGKRHHGKKTSSGEKFNMNSLTASHHTYPFGTIVKVTNLKNDHSVIIRVNDRMPVRNKRIIDVSFQAAKELNIVKAGTTKVKLEVLKWGKETLK